MVYRNCIGFGSGVLTELVDFVTETFLFLLAISHFGLGSGP